MIVLMQADYPIGIYTTTEKAEEAAEEHYQRRYGISSHAKPDFYYRQYDFEVDGNAR